VEGREMSMKDRNRLGGVRVLFTEVQTLDEACDIIAWRQQLAKTFRAQTPLGQQFAIARVHAIMTKRRGKISLPNGASSKREVESKSKKAHPLRDLEPEAMRAKVREMYQGGYWGSGSIAVKRLAKEFKVSAEQIVGYLVEERGNG
jgi:hypothetical protein